MKNNLEKMDRLFKALEKSTQVAVAFLEENEEKDKVRVETALKARAEMLSFLRAESRLITEANEGFDKKSNTVRGQHYIHANLNPGGYLEEVRSRSSMALYIPNSTVYVVTKSSAQALADWKTSVKKQFGGGVRTAEEMMIRNQVIAVNPYSDNLRDDFMGQLVRMNEAFFKK